MTLGTVFSSTEDGYFAQEDGANGPTSWFSKNGRDWQVGTAQPPTPACPDGLAPCDMQSFAAGWMAFAAEPGDGVAPSLWRSSDGVQWVRVTTLPDGVASTFTGLFWVAPDGTTLVALDPTGSGDTGQMTLGVLDRAGTWRRIDYPAACPFDLNLVLPPAVGGPDMWALSDGWKTCVSPNLREWRKGKLPVKDGYPTQAWVATKHGILAIGADSDSICDRPYQLLSPDGSHWSRIKPGLKSFAIVDGPAGVLGLSGGCDGEPSAVWKLEP